MIQEADIYRKNISFLKNNIPQLYEAVQTTNTSHIKTDISNNGINIKVGNHYIYPENSSEFLGLKIQSFFEKPTAFMKEPLIFKKDPITTPIQDIYLSKIESKLPQLQSKLQYDKHLDSIPILLLFGIGTGQEIEQLISLVDIKTLVIVDQDFGMIKNSMSIINWKPIFEYFSRDSYSLEFKISINSNSLSLDIINFIFKSKPYYSRYINYFSSYSNEFIQNIINDFQKNYPLLFNGWGFYDDDLLSLNHTIENINNNRAIFLNNKPFPKNSSVFIIGSGPSIDQDIENIKKLQNNVIIFSCGTALVTLEANNILPDYHFEIERPISTYSRLKDFNSKEYLKQINFIGLNVIFPKVLELFKTAKIFFRDADGGASLTTNDIPKLKHCNPTVVNGALAFASEIGFSNIYLFGTDMGYKDKTQHHSKYNVYTSKDSQYHGWEPYTLEQKFPKNFNKTSSIYSSDLLLWCKQRAENCMKDYLYNKQIDIKYFNCSDGAYINNTIPLKSENIILSTIQKQDILNALEANFSYNDKPLYKNIQNNFEIQKKLAINDIDTIIDTIKNNGDITTYSQYFELLDSTYKTITSNSPILYSLSSGTIAQLYSFIYTYSLLSNTIEDSFIFINSSLNIIIEFLNQIKQDLSRYNKEG